MIRSFGGKAPQIASTAFVDSSAQLIGDVQIGEHSSVWFNCVIRADVYHVRIGNNTNLQDGSIIHVTAGRFATILGDCVTVGHGVMLHGCRVMDRSLIGIGAIILDGVVIGEESFVAAGSLVTPGTVIPPRSMVMGSPAKVRRQVTSEEIKRIDEHWQHYVEYKDKYFAEARVAQGTGL